MSTGRIGCG